MDNYPMGFLAIIHYQLSIVHRLVNRLIRFHRLEGNDGAGNEEGGGNEEKPPGKTRIDEQDDDQPIEEVADDDGNDTTAIVVEIPLEHHRHRSRNG